KTTGEGALPVFRFPLDVRVLVGVKPTSQRLDVTDAEQTFYIACDDEPSAATIDPRREVLGTLEVDKPVDWWINELKSAPEARARTEAALALGKDASIRAVDALGAALLKDRFWATQGACAKALGQVRTSR